MIKYTLCIGEGFPDRFTFDVSTGHMYFTVSETTDERKAYIAVMDPLWLGVYKTLIPGLDFPLGIAGHPEKG